MKIGISGFLYVCLRVKISSTLYFHYILTGKHGRTFPICDFEGLRCIMRIKGMSKWLPLILKIYCEWKVFFIYVVCILYIV